MTTALIAGIVVGQVAGPSKAQTQMPPKTLDAIYARQAQNKLSKGVTVKGDFLVELPDQKVSFKFVQSHKDYHHLFSLKSSPQGPSFESAANKKEIWGIDGEKKAYYYADISQQELGALELRNYILDAWNKELAKGFGGENNDDDPFKIRMQLNPVALPEITFAVPLMVQNHSKKTEKGKTTYQYNLEGKIENGAILGDITTEENGLITQAIFDLTTDGYIVTVTLKRTEWSAKALEEKSFAFDEAKVKGYKKSGD